MSEKDFNKENQPSDMYPSIENRSNTELLEEIEKLRKQFPYNAAEMLADPDQIEAYKKALEHRLRAAVEECNRRRQEIDSMMGKVAAHG